LPVGSRDKLTLAGVNLANVVTKELLVAWTAVLDVMLVSPLGDVHREDGNYLERLAVTVTVNAAMKLNWVTLQFDTVLRYVLVTVLVFTHPEQSVGYTVGG